MSSFQGRRPQQRAGSRQRGRGRHQTERTETAHDPFFLYVEGPRDGDLIRVWARRLSPSLARHLERCIVILGGRQPRRAVEHFRAAHQEKPAKGLVVLDRDHHDPVDDLAEPGLELFTWGRRHIESYVLVRDAIRRVVERHDDVEWAHRVIDDLVPEATDEAVCRDLDAKRLLGAKGPLARELGTGVSPAAIARTMRADELHADVHSLYRRIRAGLGLEEPAFQVVRRPRQGS